MLSSQCEELSKVYFESCSDLYQIAESFSLEQITEQKQIRDLENEFELIRALTETKKHKMRFRSNNVHETKKNRYPQQSIYEHSRVVLDRQEGNGNKEGYINANLIQMPENQEKKLIITQGPTTETIKDLQRMIIKEDIQCMVMLCRHKENGKDKCADYFQCMEDLKTEQIQQIGGYLDVKGVTFRSNGKEHHFTYVWYKEWPDRRVPKDIGHIDQIIENVKQFRNYVIHCSAGLGRSGVVAAILIILESEEWKKERKFSIFETVRKMREYRFGAVQNSEQYRFIYEYFEYLSFKEQESQK